MVSSPILFRTASHSSKMPILERGVEVVDSDARHRRLRVVALHAVLFQKRLHLLLERRFERDGGPSAA